METPPPAAVDESELHARLVADWPVQADDLQYVPKGAGSYHWLASSEGQPRWFVTVDDLDTKPWIAHTRASTFDGLRAAYQTAWRLQHTVGLPFVIGPLPRHDGGVIVRLSDQHTMAVFPYVEGVAGVWGEPLLEERRSVLLRDLARLHEAPTGPHSSTTRLLPDLPERPLLTVAMQDLDGPWRGGPHSEPARLALVEHADDVTSWLAELDALAAVLDAEGGDLVLTHGEPHPGNLIQTADGLRLIDWDTAALAARERDLWMLDDGSADVFELYEAACGRRVSDAGISFYRLAWTLSDIACFIGWFRSPHVHTQWLDDKWDGYLRLLTGAASRPYAPR